MFFSQPSKSKNLVQHHRRHRWASALLITVSLALTAGAYTAISATAQTSTPSSEADQKTLNEGEKLFQANCATCHGLNAEGSSEAPSLIGVGAASVDFQVGTGRMPMQMQGPQAQKKPVQFTQSQINAMATYVDSLGATLPVIDEKYLTGNGDIANGGELFRINCAMCHNVAGAGGALTEGKFAPPLSESSPYHIYEAMLIGPQNMPVFNDYNLTPQDKSDIISYIQFLNENPSPGGFKLGSLGPVAEGLTLWVFGFGAIVSLAVWVTKQAK